MLKKDPVAMHPYSSLCNYSDSIERMPLITKEELDDNFQGGIVHNLRVHDLPSELWMEIVSYLPKGSMWKMIGINRLLFELGMSEIYEEACLLDCDKTGYKTFEQIGHENIAPRVQRLYIRPTFLPGLDCDGRRVYDRDLTFREFKSRKAQINTFLALALTSLGKCSHIRELTVEVQSQHCLTDTFAKFLRKLIKLVGAELDSLTIDMTIPNFIPTRNAFDPKLLPKLSSLAIKFPKSHFTTPAFQARMTRRALLSLITSLGSTLQSLAFGVLDRNLSKLYGKLQKLPLLRSLELRPEINSYLMPTVYFVSFLQRNASNLERLVLRRSTVDLPEPRFLDVVVCGKYDRLCAQHLPKLKELVVEMEFPVILTSLTSNLHTFVPHLRNLILTGQSSVLDNPKLTSLLTSLANCDKGLAYLKVSLSCFCPQHLDLLASFLPNLQKLELTYEVLWVSTELTGIGLSIYKQDDIYDAFRNRKYGRWGLEELRLLEVLNCPEGHPDHRLLDVIANGLLSIKRINRARTCDCIW